MISSLSHVALLVPSAERSAHFLNSRGIETQEAETFESEGTKEIYVGSYEKQSGLLLLLEAISDGPYKRALAKRGPSLHHIAIDVSNVADFISVAQKMGWNLHPTSAQTMEYKTAWLFQKGVPTLIEVHQKKSLSVKPSQVSQLILPIKNEQMGLFESLGLAQVVSPGEDLRLTVDGKEFSFAQIAQTSN